MSNPTPPEQPGQPYQLPPNYQPPPPEKRSGIPTWVWVVLAAVGGSALLCVILAIVVVGFLTVLGSRVSEVFSEINTGLVEGVDANPTPFPVEAAAALSLGDTATVADLRVTVTDAYATSEVAGLMAPFAGNQYWVIEATFENTSDINFAWLGPYDTWLQDGAGNSYEYYWEAAGDENFFGTGEIVDPGQTVSGTFVYEVPEEAGELVWIYVDSDIGEQTAFALP